LCKEAKIKGNVDPFSSKVLSLPPSLPPSLLLTRFSLQTNLIYFVLSRSFSPSLPLSLPPSHQIFRLQKNLIYFVLTASVMGLGLHELGREGGRGGRGKGAD